MRFFQILATGFGIVCHLILAEPQLTAEWRKPGESRGKGAGHGVAQRSHQEPRTIPDPKRMLTTSVAASFLVLPRSRGFDQENSTSSGEVRKTGERNVDIMSLIRYLITLRERLKANRTAFESFTEGGDKIIYSLSEPDILKIFGGKPTQAPDHGIRKKRSVREELGGVASDPEDIGDVLVIKSAEGHLGQSQLRDEVNNVTEENQGADKNMYFSSKGRRIRLQAGDTVANLGPDISGHFDSRGKNTNLQHQDTSANQGSDVVGNFHSRGKNIDLQHQGTSANQEPDTSGHFDFRVKNTNLQHQGTSANQGSDVVGHFHYRGKNTDLQHQDISANQEPDTMGHFDSRGGNIDLQHQDTSANQGPDTSGHFDTRVKNIDLQHQDTSVHQDIRKMGHFESRGRTIDFHDRAIVANHEPDDRGHSNARKGKENLQEQDTLADKEEKFDSKRKGIRFTFTGLYSVAQNAKTRNELDYNRGQWPALTVAELSDKDGPIEEVNSPTAFDALGELKTLPSTDARNAKNIQSSFGAPLTRFKTPSDNSKEDDGDVMLAKGYKNYRARGSATPAKEINSDTAVSDNAENAFSEIDNPHSVNLSNEPLSNEELERILQDILKDEAEEGIRAGVHARVRLLECKYGMCLQVDNANERTVSDASDLELSNNGKQNELQGGEEENFSYSESVDDPVKGESISDDSGSGNEDSVGFPLISAAWGRFDPPRYSTHPDVKQKHFYYFLPVPLIFKEESWIQNSNSPTFQLHWRFTNDLRHHESLQLNEQDVMDENVSSHQIFPGKTGQNFPSSKKIAWSSRTPRLAIAGKVTNQNAPESEKHTRNPRKHSIAHIGVSSHQYAPISKQDKLTWYAMTSKKSSSSSNDDSQAGSTDQITGEDEDVLATTGKARPKRDTSLQATGPPEDIQYNASTNKLTIVVPVPDMVVTKTELKFDKGSISAEDQQQQPVAKEPSVIEALAAGPRGQIRRTLAGIIARLPDPEKIGKALRDRLAEVHAAASSDLRSLLSSSRGGKRFDGHAVAGIQGEFHVPNFFV